MLSPETRVGDGKNKSEQESLRRETTLTLMQSFVDAGGVEYTNITELLKQFTEELVVRREDPRKVRAALSLGTPITLAFPDGERYSNAVLWDPAFGDRALDNAFLEGFTHLHHVVAVIGFNPTPALDIQDLPDASQRFAGLDRRFVRSVQGTVAPEDIRFVIIKAPGNSFPEELMTERERDRVDTEHGAPIFRGYSFAREHTH